MSKSKYQRPIAWKQLSNENRTMSQLQQEKNNHKIRAVKSIISKKLLKSQIKSDHQFKEMFRELYPNEYRKALGECMKRYGATEKKEVRREQIVEDMKIRNKFILKRLP